MDDTLEARPLTAAQARRLTDRIARAAESLWILLAEAHDGRAWEALGYLSWAAYVDAEFGMKQANAYRLVQQARAVGELAEAAGLPTSRDVVAVSARAATDILPALPEVLDRVRAAVKGKHLASRPAVVAAVVDEYRRENRHLPAAHRVTVKAAAAGEPPVPGVAAAVDALVAANVSVLVREVPRERLMAARDVLNRAIGRLERQLQHAS